MVVLRQTSPAVVWIGGIRDARRSRGRHFERERHGTFCSLLGCRGHADHSREQTKWITALIPGITNLLPQDHALPPWVLTDITQARAIVLGRSVVPGLSMIAYGMGWLRLTYLGNEVRLLALSGTTTETSTVSRRSSSTRALYLGTGQ